MAELRELKTASERLTQLERDRKILRRERMIREVAGPVWRRMVRVVPLSLEAEGHLVARELLAPRQTVIEAMQHDAVFAADTAMRLAHGVGFLAGEDVQAYLPGVEALDRLAASGLVSTVDDPTAILVRPWPGRPRLLACLVASLPPARTVDGGFRVVTRERLGRELIGTVGPRADLFVLYESVEGLVGSLSTSGRA